MRTLEQCALFLPATKPTYSLNYLFYFLSVATSLTLKDGTDFLTTYTLNFIGQEIENFRHAFADKAKLLIEKKKITKAI